MNEKIMTQPDSRVKKPFLMIVGAAAIISGILVWFLFLPTHPTVEPSKVTTKDATILPQLRTLQPFFLIDQTGKPFDNQSLLGKWTFLNFGYTHCPDICPTTLALLSAMNQHIHSLKDFPPYQVAFVSIDPQRDTQKRLADYLNYFDPAFIGATGSDDALQKLTQPLGILYAKVETEKSAMGYVMDHSASIALIDPQGRYHALFTPPHDALNMAEDFLAIAANP